jgi:hypothetical protein
VFLPEMNLILHRVLGKYLSLRGASFDFQYRATKQSQST